VVGDNPWDLVYNPLNNKVYCANDWSNTVSVIDDTSDSVITTIPVGSSPRAWNPIQNRTYVANYFSYTVSVIRDSIIEGAEERQTPDALSLTPEIYPNPAKGVIYIRVPLTLFLPHSWREDRRRGIKIFDISGKMIKGIKILRSVAE
jgi:YVTN family beta-propeller protein